MNKNEIIKMMENHLKLIADLIKKTNIPEPVSIRISNIDKIDESVLEPIKSYKNENIVYLIMLKEELNNATTPENIVKLFEKIRAKHGKDNWCISNVNHANWKADSRCLYVGSSHGGIMTRMKQHLAVGNLTSRKTYSFWLKDWFGKSGLPQEIEISFLALKDLSSDDIYMIEDLLWRGLSPLFGRPGKSPKS